MPPFRGMLEERPFSRDHSRRGKSAVVDDFRGQGDLALGSNAKRTTQAMQAPGPEIWALLRDAFARRGLSEPRGWS